MNLSVFVARRTAVSESSKPHGRHPSGPTPVVLPLQDVFTENRMPSPPTRHTLPHGRRVRTFTRCALPSNQA